MIPVYDEQGNLPPGIHVADWQEFKNRYGYNSYRRELLNGLEAGMEILRRAGCKRIYVDGSFITTKEQPGDFDACWDATEVDIDLLDALEPAFLELRPPRKSQKEKFGGEFFPADIPASLSGQIFKDFFQVDKNGNPKGIVVIELGS